MSRRTLYTHFKSKEELYHYVVEDEVKTINEKLQKAADSRLPADRKLKLYILQLYPEKYTRQGGEVPGRSVVCRENREVTCFSLLYFPVFSVAGLRCRRT
mgnify:CR=1 FL=1